MAVGELHATLVGRGTGEWARGVGMVAVVAPEDRDRTLAILAARHIESWVIGELRASGEGETARAVLSGSHPQF